MIELNRSTDDLLQKVASAENELDPDLLREVIPDEAEFIDSVTGRGLRNDPSVKLILKRLDRIGQESCHISSQRTERIARGDPRAPEEDGGSCQEEGSRKKTALRIAQRPANRFLRRQQLKRRPSVQAQINHVGVKWGVGEIFNRIRNNQGVWRRAVCFFALTLALTNFSSSGVGETFMCGQSSMASN